MPVPLRDFFRRLVHGQAPSATGGEIDDELDGVAGDPLWIVVPPDGVRLDTCRRAKTGQGGRGVLARYSDGTTASVMVNSDGSVRVLLFRAEQGVPAVALPSADGGLTRYTWQRHD